MRDFVPVDRVYQTTGVGMSCCAYLKRGCCESEKALVECFPVVAGVGLSLLLQKLVRTGLEGFPHRFPSCDVQQRDPDIQVALV